MSAITKKYVDYTGLGSFKSKVDSLVDDKISAIDDFTGATSSTDGVAGLVPAPEAGEQNKFLRGDGTWSDADFIGTEQEWNTLSTAEKSKFRLILITDSSNNNVDIVNNSSVSGVLCYRNGAIKQVTFGGTTAASIPSGFRPTASKYLGVAFDAISKESVLVYAESSGAVSIQEMGTATVLNSYELYGTFTFMY